MSEQLTIGQSLTTEQVRNLPDGAEVEIYGSKANAQFNVVLRGYEHNAFIANKLEYFCMCCTLVSLPPAPSEHSRRIEPQAEPANPELPVWVITCDRCGTTYKNNERHACAASEPSEPSPGEGYRWVEIGERLITGDQRESSRGAGDWFADNLPGVSCQDVHCYRRRIEPQAEPAKPERQASEMAKRAALIALGPLFEDCHDAMRDAMDERDYDYLYDFWTNVEGVFRRYREMYDYAKSIGAIE